MSSPTQRAKTGSMSGRSSARSTSRRDVNQTPEPMPFDFTSAPFLTEAKSAPATEQKWERVLGTKSRQNTPTLNHARTVSNFRTLDQPEDRLSAGPSIIMSSMSSMPSLKESPKKPGGLKATIKRMFGSKRQRTLVDDARKEYHKSDPGNLMSARASPQSRHGSSSSSPRPRTSMQRNALGSHAVNPATVIRDVEAYNGQDFSTTRPRRNTLPSLAFSEHEAQSFSRRLEDLVTNEPKGEVCPDIITPTKNKRRSKSTDALAQKYIADASDTNTRQDRESEIAFWRNSILLNPLSKSTTQPSDSRSAEAQDDNIKEMPSLESIIRPAQSFDFGLDNVDEPIDLEERVSTLEVKMYDFEYAIARLQGIDIPKPPLPTKKWKRKNVQEVFSKPSIQSFSTATSGGDRPPVTPSDSPIMSTSFKENLNPDRTSKATTIRPLTRLDPLSRSSLHLTAEQFENLMTLLQDEKDARQLMELQILDLQKEIELLQTPVYATINYPTDADDCKASTQKKLHRSPPFHFSKPPQRETSRFSTTESESESVDDNYEEDFETPRERQYRFDSRNDATLVGLVS